MKRELLQHRVIRLTFEILIILSIIVVLGVFYFGREFNDVRDFDDDWTVIQDDQRLEHVKLSQYEFPHIMNKGDSVVLLNTLPQDIDKPSSVTLLVYLSTVDVFVDGKKFYSYGRDINEEGKMVGSGYHFIPLPDDCAGKEIHITISSCEDDAFSSIPVIQIVPAQRLISCFTRQHLISLFISIFLVVCGSIFMFISIAGIVQGNSLSSAVWLGAFAFLIGIWSLCSTKTIQIFSPNMAINTKIEYEALFLAIIPLLVQIYSLRKDSVKWKRYLIRISLSSCIAYAFVAPVLHYTDIAHYCKTLSAFHFIMVVALLIIIIAGWKPLSDLNASDKVLNIGFFVLFATGGVDLIRFIVQKYLLSTDQNLSNSLLPLGALVFILFLAMSYLFYVYNRIMDEESQKNLVKLAFHDPLTGLYNRAKWEDLADTFNQSDEDYTIISLDLNGLKSVNDTFGHSRGDLLLTSFANNLKETFDSEDYLIRMGGDEFVVVSKQEKNKLDHAMVKLTRLNHEVSKQLEFEIQSAFGMASKKEAYDMEFEKLYQIADERMYQMKMKMKKSVVL